MKRMTRSREEREMRGSGERFRSMVENTSRLAYAFESHPNARLSFVYAGPGLRDLIGENATTDVKSNVDHPLDPGMTTPAMRGMPTTHPSPAGKSIR